MNDLTQSSRVPNWCKGVLLAGMLLFAFYASTHMVAAGDTWVALACGRHFDQHGVDNVEPFSFNSHPAGPSDETLARWPAWTHGIIRYWHPTGWINQNWLTHLTYYKLASWFGADGAYNYNTLVVWKFAIYTLTVFCVFAIGKTMGAGWLLSAAAACLAMVIGRSFFDIRPAGYTNLLTPAFVLVLALATYKHWRWIWLLVPLVVFWANVHGGYIYAFIMLVPFIGVHFLLLLPRRWTVSLGFVGLWLVLYMMSYKFLTNNYLIEYQKQFVNPAYEPVSLLGHNLFIAWFALAAISIGLAFRRKTPAGVFYLYHVIAGFVFFAALLSRFIMSVPAYSNLRPQFRELLLYQISSSRASFNLLAIIAVLLILAMALKKDRFMILPVRGLFHTVGAAAAAFVAMVVFNPYRLTNLTHTFEISVSKHAESWRMVNEWKPAFDWMDKTTSAPNPVGDEEWFLAFCILTGIVVAGWMIVYFAMRPRTEDKGSRRMSATNANAAVADQWPKVDLAIILVALLTIYMAVASRRFIAVAGSAAAPVIFLLIRQIGQMVAARYPLNGIERFKAPAARRWQTFGCGAIAAVLLGLGLFWGVKFHRVYLAPWPSEHEYTSVFMRMTASHLKPFEVCEFLNDNQLTGRVFNHWTEGGAVAFGQNPDPETGEIPLKLFMDGRAQAAYNHSTFLLWNEISTGGPAAKALFDKGKRVTDWTTEEFRSVGRWIDGQLKQRDVWVTLMPATQDQEDSLFMRSLRSLPNWKTAYTDRMQRLLVDTDSEQGKTLIDKVLRGEAKFPDKLSKSLTVTTAIFENNYVQRMGDLYAIAKEGFDVFPHPSMTIALTRVSGVPQFRDKITEDLKNYIDDFERHKETYMNQDGFLYRLSSAQVASIYLSQRAEAEDRSRWNQQAAQYREASRQMGLNRIW
jgi:hypothetical protein